MRVHRFLAGAQARTAPNLVAKAGALARRLETQGLQAQAVLVGEAAQCLQCRALRAKQTVYVRDVFGAKVVHQAQALRVEGEAAELGGATQLPVEGRKQLLHQRRLAQQRPELARGALPLDAAHLARELHLARRAQVVGEVREHARTHVDALTHIERGAVLAVE